MVADGHGEAVPELIRRVQLSSCRHDPVPSFVAVVTNAAATGVAVHDVLADSGYSYKVPEHFALPLRRIGARLVIDLHPADQGMKGHLRRRDLCERQPVLPRHAKGAARPRTASPGREP
jgi:hypothetical protein